MSAPLLSFLIVVLACSACNASRPGGAPAPVMSAPLAQIHAMVGVAACTESAQCKTLALGASACGGPESYLAYSTATAATAPLKALAMRHAQQRNDALMKAGEASPCHFIVDPGAQCHAGTCVLNAGPAPAKKRLRPPPEA